MLERHFDPETEILSVIAAGELTVAEVDRNCAEVRQIVTTARGEHRPVRVLYDVTALPRQKQDFEAYIVGKIVDTFQDEDRCAILTQGHAEKRHFQHVVSKPQIVIFASRLPAEMWLLFEENRSRRAAFERFSRRAS